MADKRVQFSGDSSRLISEIDKLDKKNKNFYSNSINAAREYSKNARDQFVFLKEQIALMEKRNNLEKQYEIQEAKKFLRGKELSSTLSGINQRFDEKGDLAKKIDVLIDTIKVTAKEQIAEDKKSVEKRIRLYQSDPKRFTKEEQLLLAYQQELLMREKAKPSLTAMSVFKGVMGAELVKGVVSTISSIPQVRDEMGAIMPRLQLAGIVRGGALGFAAGGIAGALQTGTGGTAAGRGALEGAGIGSKIGQEISTIIGSFVTRNLEEQAKLETSSMSGRALSGFSQFSLQRDRRIVGYTQEESVQANNRFEAQKRLAQPFGRDPQKMVTEKGKPIYEDFATISAPDYSMFGYGFSQSSDISNQMASARGRRVDSDTLNAIILSRATEVDIGATASLVGTSRFSSNPLAAASTLYSGRFAQGDRSGFPDAVKSLTKVIESFSQQSEKVNSQVAAQNMLMFNRIGGGFSITDPRSAERITGISQALGKSDGGIAFAEDISILRQLNPEASDLELLKMQERGMQTPGYLQGHLKKWGRRFGDSDSGTFALKSYFQKKGFNLTYEAAEDLYKNREKLMTLPAAQTDEYIQKYLKEPALSQSPSMEKSMADISNQFTISMKSGIDTVEKYFEKAMKTVSDKMVEYADEILKGKPGKPGTKVTP